MARPDDFADVFGVVGGAPRGSGPPGEAHGAAPSYSYGHVPDPGAPGPAPGRPPSRRVLVVDHHRDAADTLATVLRLKGHHVRTVYDGRAATRAAAAFRPEFVLIDLGLPWIDAADVCRSLRASRAADGPLHAIGLGNPEAESVEGDAAASGFEAVLANPLDHGRLSDLLRKDDRGDRGRSG